MSLGWNGSVESRRIWGRIAVRVVVVVVVVVVVPGEWCEGHEPGLSDEH